MFSRVILVIAVVAVPCGCATILSGTSQTVRFSSQPAGASVVVGDQSTRTPGTVALKKGSWQREAIFTLEGHQQAKVTISGHIDAIYYLNIITSLGLGCMVDMASGAWLKYDDSYHVPLTPFQQPTIAIAPAAPTNSSTPATGAAFCSSCGAKFAPEARFCQSCGKAK